MDLSSNLWNGLAESDTGGFIDVRDMPAWDAWVAYVAPFLISWVPAELVPDVENGAINTCPTNSFGWADNYEARGWIDVWKRLSQSAPKLS
jgi:hypothetical protein